MPAIQQINFLIDGIVLTNRQWIELQEVQGIWYCHHAHLQEKCNSKQDIFLEIE